MDGSNYSVKKSPYMKEWMAQADTLKRSKYSETNEWPVATPLFK